MSVGENIPGEDPFVSSPLIRLLDGELDAIAADVARDEACIDPAVGYFGMTEVLLDLRSIQPNTLVTFDTKDDDEGPCTVRLVRGEPAPTKPVEWYWLPEGFESGEERMRPVMIGGSHISGSLFGDRHRVRAGHNFSFYEVAVFRSSDDMPRGSLTGESLPSPDRLRTTDPILWAKLITQGLITTGENHRFFWRLPTVTHETGPVLMARAMQI